MTCAERERELALYAGGELSNGDLEGHLDRCARCREYVDGMRSLLGDLSLGDPPALPPIATAVMRRIRRRRYGWAALAASAAAASVLIAAIVGMVSRPVATMSYALPMPAPPAVTVVQRAVPEAKRRLVRQVARPKPVPPAESVVVKLVTDDPNVIIYWITD
jgi:predicted anti-sigma-YlaC factor YlaD